MSESVVCLFSDYFTAGTLLDGSNNDKQGTVGILYVATSYVIVIISFRVPTVFLQNPEINKNATPTLTDCSDILRSRLSCSLTTSVWLQAITLALFEIHQSNFHPPLHPPYNPCPFRSPAAAMAVIGDSSGAIHSSKAHIAGTGGYPDDSHNPFITAKSEFANTMTAIEAGYLLQDTFALVYEARLQEVGQDSHDPSCGHWYRSSCSALLYRTWP